jgi:hypothetical protein
VNDTPAGQPLAEGKKDAYKGPGATGMGSKPGSRGGWDETQPTLELTVPKKLQS